ncbi:MAG: hypothetical protein IJ043_02925 [Clostridia bacterium]|nr:hypothetical protein [Clostridia bacterium]
MNFDFRKSLLQVHKSAIRDKTYEARSNEFILSAHTSISIHCNADEVVKTAVSDFVDYLKTSMDVDACIRNDSKAEITVSLSDGVLGEFESYRGFCISTDKCGIQIVSHDNRGIAQALYYIEDMMTFKKAPVMEYGKVCKKTLYSPQMVHSGYGLDDYPDEYLSYIAHEGRDAILVFTKDVNRTPTGYLDFNDLIERAARYGIDVYAYSYMVSTKSPYDDDAEEFYENTYGRLFKECPKLRGVTLVGESVEFPSKDENVAKGRYFETAVDGIPSAKPSSGWYPCYDYPVWLELVKKSIQQYSPDADIVFWTYNWAYQPEDKRVALINSLPTDISLQATFEMVENIYYENSVGRCADYTLSFAGPSGYFKSEAEAARRRGIRLYSMTNTGGRTWDFGVVPYEPMPYQWMKRYKEMEKAHDEYGLCGIMETHHYGFYPSFISKLSKHMFMTPHDENILKDILISEYGEKCYELVNKAVSYFSEAITYYVPSSADQYGAFRVGPSYPFNLSKAVNVPCSEEANFGNDIITPTYRNQSDSRMSPLSIRIGDELRSLEKMLDLMKKGVLCLEQAETENDELLNLARFMVCCIQTGIHAKKWHMLICKMNVCDNKSDLLSIYGQMQALLEDEIENAESAVPLVEKDSRLGFEPSMLYVTDKWHIEWKIRQVRYVIDTDLQKYRKGIEL